MKRNVLLWLLLFYLPVAPTSAAPLPASLADARVLADEVVLSTTPSNNGANPMWCAGAPLIVRDGGAVWASISVHDPDAQPYCNNHWELWRRPASGSWAKFRQGTASSEREPCPLFLLGPETLVLSIQPKILARSGDSHGETTWYCQPALAVFEPTQSNREPRLWLPEFGQTKPFTQHSYRGVGVDPKRNELLLMVIDHDDNYRPTWRDTLGAWHPLAAPAFPIRSCYPGVILRDRAAYVLAIGDIVEPNAEWKAERFRVLKRNWDYAFRQLFYSWTPDVATEGFRPPLEIDSADDTAGWMFNLDLLIDSKNRIHLLWVRRTFEYDFMRDRFFPDQPNIEAVMHALVDQGRVVAKETLLSRVLPAAERHPFISGRLHELPDGRVVAALVEPGVPNGAGLFLQEMDLEAKSSPAAFRVPLARPLATGMFFTNTPRGGSKPEHALDLLGTEIHDGLINLRYLHVHIP